MPEIGYALSSEEHQHPAIIAQAAATSAALMPGRFRLGVGTGENLNEHILGDRWPETDVRREMLEEAMAPEEDVVKQFRHAAGVKQFLDAGYTHVYVHQLGPDQDGFLSFYESEVLPKLR